MCICVRYCLDSPQFVRWRLLGIGRSLGFAHKSDGVVSLAAVFWMSRNAPPCVTSKKRLRGRLVTGMITVVLQIVVSLGVFRQESGRYFYSEWIGWYVGVGSNSTRATPRLIAIRGKTSAEHPCFFQIGISLTPWHLSYKNCMSFKTYQIAMSVLHY